MSVLNRYKVTYGEDRAGYQDTSGTEVIHAKTIVEAKQEAERRAKSCGWIVKYIKEISIGEN